VDCLADPAVRAEAEGALAEIGRALQLEYGFSPEEMARWNERVIRQTDNPTLGDTVARHGADPRRKLRRADRLVGPLLLAHRHHLAAPHLVRAIAAALLYRNPDDPGALFVQSRLAEVGPAEASRELCEFGPDEEELVGAIAAEYEAMLLAQAG
jgi:mannitol-1-phosphate 5-dehydrogenase